MKKLPLLLLLLIIFEIVALINVGSHIGALLTIALFVLSSFVGLGIIKRQGAYAALSVGRKISQGIFPKRELVKSLVFVIAGVLLIIPGFITDGLGVCVFLYGLLHVLFQPNAHANQPDLHGFEREADSYKPHNQKSNKGTTIDGEYNREDD